MKSMKVLVRLYDMVHPAADGSTISRTVTEEYLRSSDYEKIIKDKLSMGGFTHKDRDVDDKYRNIVGPDDQIIISNNYLFYISKIFTKENDDFSYAIITFFDEDNFSGEVKDNIINLKGLLKTGVMLPSSVVIQAVWGMDNSCKKIIRIKGLDFTLNPSFKGAGAEKLMSQSAAQVDTEPNEGKTKSFSGIELSEGDKIATKVFSFDSVVTIDEEIDDNGLVTPKDEVTVQTRILTEDELKELTEDLDKGRVFCILKYGLNSKQSQLTKCFTQSVQSSYDGTVSIIDDNKEYLNNLDKFIELLKDVVDDTELLAYVFNNNKNDLLRLVIGVPQDAINYDELIKPYLIQYFTTLPDAIKNFSTQPSTIVDRMRLVNYPRYVRLRRLLDTYKATYSLKKDLFNKTPDSNRLLSLLFVSDVMLLIKSVSDLIYQGSTLSTLYQLTTYGNEVFTTGFEFSQIYRKVLLSEKILGFIPKGIYEQYTITLKNFLSELSKYAFGDEFTSSWINVVDKLNLVQNETNQV